MFAHYLLRSSSNSARLDEECLWAAVFRSFTDSWLDLDLDPWTESPWASWLHLWSVLSLFGLEVQVHDRVLVGFHLCRTLSISRWWTDRCFVRFKAWEIFVESNPASVMFTTSSLTCLMCPFSIMKLLDFMMLFAPQNSPNKPLRPPQNSFIFNEIKLGTGRRYFVTLQLYVTFCWSSA